MRREIDDIITAAVEAYQRVWAAFLRASIIMLRRTKLDGRVARVVRGVEGNIRFTVKFYSHREFLGYFSILIYFEK